MYGKLNQDCTEIRTALGYFMEMFSDSDRIKFEFYCSLLFILYNIGGLCFA